MSRRQIDLSLGQCWQEFTATNEVLLATDLPEISVDENTFADLANLCCMEGIKQQGPYHDGCWHILSLMAPDGAPGLQDVNYVAKYLPTPVLAKYPRIARFLFSLDGSLRRVRISRLKSGGQITWHVDDFQEKTGEKVFRIHIPIITSAENFQVIGHYCSHWSTREIWLGDYRFPHMVVNNSANDRFHLIVDLVPSDALVTEVNKTFQCDWFGAERSRLAQTAKEMLLRWRSSNGSR